MFLPLTCNFSSIDVTKCECLKLKLVVFGVPVVVLQMHPEEFRILVVESKNDTSICGYPRALKSNILYSLTFLCEPII